MQPIRHKMTIPSDLDAKVIADALKENDPNVEVYIVGGAVRDCLYHSFHGDTSKPYKPKDIDLTTNLSEEEILAKLNSPLAKKRRIRVKEKESLDTFGVVFASVDGKGPYEVAPFRKDIGSSDGRHPDRIERGTIYEDAMRRDLTINNLYYNIEEEVILDFNPNGQGVADIQSKTVRTVGDPFGRFEEDKLRILRMIRFFSRYNDGLIIEYLDECTMRAIEKYKKLYDFKGMSPERVQTEFMLGMSQCMNMPNYIRNYADLDLFQTVFPSGVDLAQAPKLEKVRSPRVVLASLLRNSMNVSSILNDAKYTSDTDHSVRFLLSAMNFDQQHNCAVGVIKMRDRKFIRLGKKKTELTNEDISHNVLLKQELEQDLNEACELVSDERAKILKHLITYVPSHLNGEDLMEQGYQKLEIGVKQREHLHQHYLNDFAAKG